MISLCYLLDSDICVYIANGKPASVREKFARLKPGEVAISVIAYGELLTGALNSQRVEQNLEQLYRFTEQVPVLPWNDAAALEYARIRVDLKRRGTPIGPYDCQIAGHALALGVILVSNNLREFSRVAGLKIETWATVQ